MSASSRTSARSTAARLRKFTGHETPRIFTPPLRNLTPETSVGFAVIEFAEEVIEFDLLPWQKWLLIHALEILPDGSFRFRNVVVLVARQNGKSTLSIILSLFFMYVLGRELVIGTAQDLDVAEEIWQEAVDIVEENAELDALKLKVIRNNGKKALVLKTGERYKVKAANRRAGRGLSGDLILLDELREHQSWDAWGAITKTTMARADAMIWAFSNAGDATSIVLHYLRRMAHLALGDPDGINGDEDPSLLLTEIEEDEFELDDEDSLAIFEWSAAPGREVSDREGWCEANPSLGHTITERTIASAAKTDPEWVFRTEVLCQWSQGSLEGPFPPGSWLAGTDPQSSIASDSRRGLCVDVSHDRGMSYIGIAGLREDGSPHVEVIAQRAGTAWVPGWFQDKPERLTYGPVAVQAKGAPASSLLEELQALEGLTVLEWSGSALGSSTGAFYDGVRCEPTKNEAGQTVVPKRIYHRPQPILDIAAANAVPKLLGESYVWNRAKSPVDVAPLVAVTGALWALNRPPEAPTRSKYEDADLLAV